MRAACDKAKILLLFATQTAFEMDCLFQAVDLSSTITRARFEKINMDLLRDCMDSVEKSLRTASWKRVKFVMSLCMDQLGSQDSHVI